MLRFDRSAVLTFLAASLLAVASNAAERIDLSPNVFDGGTTRVSIQLEAGGHSLVRADSDDKSGEAPAEAERKLPISVAAKLKYDERSLVAKTTADEQGALLAIRYYDLAEAIIKVEESGRTPKLADDRRLIMMASNEEHPALSCPDGPLTREQLDLIDVVGNSLFIDRLMPAQAVASGDSWAHDASVIGTLLALDTVAACEAQSVLDEYNASFAKIRMAGTAHGTADGAATEIEIRAVYLFDRRARRVTRLNMAIRERRSIGGATPGLDAVAKVQIELEPIQNSPHLDDATVAKAKLAANTPLQNLVYDSGPMGFKIGHDRKWFVTSEQRESVTLARVDRADLIGQCTISALPPKSAGRQTSLQKFQEDVIYSLGKSFGEIVSTRQWQNAAGHYCYELVARGVVQEVPVEWHYYLVAPESGDRISVAVTLEKPMVERIAGADRELVESLELFPRMPATQTAVQRPGSNVK